jgi:hypothetical protein
MRAAVVPPVEKDGLVRVPSTAASAAAAFACQHHHHSTTATDEYGMMQCDIDNDGDHNRKIKRGHVFCGACCAKNCRCCCRHGGCCNSNDCCDMRRSVIVVNIFHGFFLCLIFLGWLGYAIDLYYETHNHGSGANTDNDEGRRGMNEQDDYVYNNNVEANNMDYFEDANDEWEDFDWERGNWGEWDPWDSDAYYAHEWHRLPWLLPILVLQIGGATCGIFGALHFNKYLVAIATLSLLARLGEVAVYVYWTTFYSVVYVTSFDNVATELARLIYVAGFCLYPHLVFLYELHTGIMTPTTYQETEKASCCLCP